MCIYIYIYTYMCVYVSQTHTESHNIIETSSYQKETFQNQTTTAEEKRDKQHK